MNREKQRSAIGAALVLVSTLLILGIVQSSIVPLLFGSVAAIGMAIGVILLGTAAKGV